MVDVGVNASLAINASNKATTILTDNYFLNLAQTTSSNGSDSCSSHPTNYFTPRGRHDVEKKLKEGIAQKIAHTDWADAWEDTNLTGVGLTVGKGSLGLNVTFSKNSQGVYSAMRYGSEDNVLNFKVTYHGDFYLDGARKLYLAFKLLPGSSAIDGIVLESLFPNSDNRVDLRKTLLSNCLREYIESIAVKVEHNNSPSSGQPSGTPGGGSSGVFCSRTVYTRAGNRNQVFIFATPCQ